MELILTRPDVTASRVTVTCDGQQSHLFDLSALIPTKANGLTHPMADPVAYGTALYSALFPPGTLARGTFERERGRILLVATDDTLDAIAWEYLYGPDGFIVCDLPFVRGLPEQRMPAPATVGSLHIIAVPSNPLHPHLAPLNIAGEWMRLVDIVQGLESAVTLERAWPPTMDRLRVLVANRQQRVVHFMGHGGKNERDEAVLCFEQDNGSPALISAREFSRRLRGGVFLVTLNACESAEPGETHFGNLAAALVREGVPFALGMRFAIHDDDALTFSRAFYDNLARGVPVEEAVFQMRLSLVKSTRCWAIGVPVLYTALTAPAPGFTTASGTPVVANPQEAALRGVIGVLPQTQGAFQGRTHELLQVGDWLTGNKRPRILTVHGSGGQGKTALAREIVERFAYAWPGGVWAGTLESLPTRTALVADLARFLGIPAQSFETAGDLEREVLLRLRQRRTLLMLDNAETLVEAVRARDADAIQLANLLQQCPGAAVSLLVTSRDALAWSGEVTLELEGLSPDDGAALFRQSAPQREAGIAVTLARRLSTRIEGHPFGLVLLGKAFNETSLSLAAFLADYETFLLKAENQFVGMEHRQRTLYANVEYSVRFLSPELRSLLSKLWLFHAPFEPEGAVAIFDADRGEQHTERSPVEDQLLALWQRGLLSRSGSEEGVLLYHVQPVLRPYIAAHLADASERESLLARFGAAYAKFVGYLYRELGRGSSTFLLAVLCRDDIERAIAHVTDSQKGDYLRRWGWVLHRLGDRTQGLALTELALEIGEGQDQTLTLHAMNNIALIYNATGRLQDALRLYEQALALMREVGDRAGERTTLNNLGGVYDDLGQKPKALDYYEQALAMLREVGDSAMEGKTLNNLGSLYDDLGQKPKALDCYEQALAIRRGVGDRATEGTTLHNIGMIYDRFGQFDVALACILLAKALYEYVQSPSDIADEVRWITRLQTRLGEQPFAALLAQVEHRASEIVERALQEKTLPDEAEQPPSTMPTEQITVIVGNTVAVMTAVPERRAEWRETIVGTLANAQQRGADWQIEVAFFTAVLAILDGQPPSLPTDHPYAAVITAIQNGIASGGLEPGDDEDDAAKGVQALAAFVQASVVALRSPNPQEKMAFMQQLAALQGQVQDDKMNALFQAIQFALVGGDLLHLGDDLTGSARQVWDMIVAGVQEDDTPPHETPVVEE